MGSANEQYHEREKGKRYRDTKPARSTETECNPTERNKREERDDSSANLNVSRKRRIAHEPLHKRCTHDNDRQPDNESPEVFRLVRGPNGFHIAESAHTPNENKVSDGHRDRA